MVWHIIWSPSNVCTLAVPIDEHVDGITHGSLQGNVYTLAVPIDEHVGGVTHGIVSMEMYTHRLFQ